MINSNTILKLNDFKLFHFIQINLINYFIRDSFIARNNK